MYSNTFPGNPPLYETAEDLQKAINDYFNTSCDKKTLYTKEGIPYEVEAPTISGLCYFLGYASRQSFYDLEKHERYSYTIKKARLFIEKIYEQELRFGNTTGAIFALKNMGWMDKSAIDHTTQGEKIEQKTIIVADHDTKKLLEELQ